MKAYSMDLRQRVLEAVDDGKRTKWEISLLYKVSPAWIRRLLQRRRLSGSIEPKQRDYSASGKVDDAVRQQLAKLVAETPDATLEELRQRLGTPLSRATICRTLAKMNLPLKKSRFAPVNRSGRMCNRSVSHFENK